MEYGKVIIYNKEIGRGFIKNSKNNLYYLFSTEDCINNIKTNDLVTFSSIGIRDAISIKLRRHFVVEFSKKRTSQQQFIII